MRSFGVSCLILSGVQDLQTGRTETVVTRGSTQPSGGGARGSDHFHRFLKGMDAFLGTSLAGVMARGKECTDSRFLPARF